MMTNEEIYKKFCDLNIPYNDYRPLYTECVNGRQGITVFLDNGDIILYFPKNQESKKGDKQMNWISVNDRMPTDEEKEYLLCVKSTVSHGDKWYTVANYSNDLHSVDFCAFSKEDGYKGKKGFYKFDSEYGYFELSKVLCWTDIEPPAEIK